jgi:hypothetical protein
MMITAELLDALVRRYAPAADQKCVVCGAPLAFSASGERGGGSRYNCSSEAATRSRAGVTLRERVEHYQASAWYDRGQTDLAVVELVKAYRELEPRAACPCFDESAERQLREDGDRWEDPRDTRGGKTDG